MVARSLGSYGRAPSVLAAVPLSCWSPSRPVPSMLHRVAGHLAPPAPAAASATAAASSSSEAPVTERRPQLLEDAQIHQFVVNGFVAVRPAALSADFHRSIKDELDVLLEAEGNPGNNLLPRIPQLQSMLDDPAVAGAVQSLCGRDALLHPHRYVHARGSDDDPANVGQSWHKDDYLYDPATRHKHLFRWIFLFYYPEDVTLDMGPTCILPGCHHLQSISHCNPQQATETPHEFTVKAGTVALCNFDNWHRGGANKSGRVRYMLKWMYMRMEEPTAADWAHHDPRWPSDVTELPRLANPQCFCPALSESLWDWLRGEWQASVAQRATSSVQHAAAAAELVFAGDDSVQAQTQRLQAAHSLRFAPPETQDAAVRLAVGMLRETNDDDFDWGTHHEKARPLGFLNVADGPVAHALSALGLAAAPALLLLLAGSERSESAIARAVAVCVLGGMGSRLLSSEQLGERAAQVLAETLTDDSEWVRRNAAHALGVLGPLPSTDLEACVAKGLASLLSDNAEMVRANAAVALARRAREAVALGSGTLGLVRRELMRTVREPQKGLVADGETLQDPRLGRYSRFYALDALRRLVVAEVGGGSAEFLSYMMQQFWCPDTTLSSPF